MALLPSRYTPEVNERVIREAARMLAEAAASGRPRASAARSRRGGAVPALGPRWPRILGP